MSSSLWPHGWQHARLPCPSPSPGACSNSCALSRWCHPTISYSVIPFSSCLQSFPASGSFPVSQFFESGGQNIGASALASVLPINIQGWLPLGLTGLISLQSMWNECNFRVVWFFGIAFLGEWNENWPFPVLWPLLSFSNLLAYWLQHFNNIIFQNLKYFKWNSVNSTSFVRSNASYSPLDFTLQDVWLSVSDPTIVVIWVIKTFLA